MSSFRPDDVPDLTGKVAIVTGGNRSIGLESVYLLLRKNCTVYISGRSESGFEEAKKTLVGRRDISEEAIARLHFHKLDLAEMKHAEASGHDFVKNHPERLDILIANAGVSMQTPDKLSPDGYELTFQTNQLGHFAFIEPLLPLFEKTAKEHGEARVVITCSDAHAFARNGIDFEALSQTQPNIGIRGMPEAMRRYGVTKLALMLYTRRLDREWAAPLRDKGTTIFVDCAHPGTILNTSLGGTGAQWGVPGFVGSLVRVMGHFIGFSSLEGAMTQVYVATSPQVKEKKEHGLYYVPRKNWRGRYIYSSDQAPDTKWGTDDELADKLWEFCEQALNKSRSASQ